MPARGKPGIGAAEHGHGQGHSTGDGQQPRPPRSRRRPQLVCQVNQRVGSAQYLAMARQNAHFRQQLIFGQIQTIPDPRGLQRLGSKSAGPQGILDARQQTQAEGAGGVIENPSAQPRPIDIIRYFCKH